MLQARAKVQSSALRGERWQFKERCTYGLNESMWYEYLDCGKDKDNTLDVVTGARSIKPGYCPDRSSEYLSKVNVVLHA